ncbi:unnamed protein product [Amoebophrya sp. A120]|nr:unnamed protein product [Amoebophrya sp. A120]|eukprot:GSA120T00020062001.1
MSAGATPNVHKQRRCCVFSGLIACGVSCGRSGFRQSCGAAPRQFIQRRRQALCDGPLFFDAAAGKSGGPWRCWSSVPRDVARTAFTFQWQTGGVFSFPDRTRGRTMLGRKDGVARGSRPAAAKLYNFGAFQRATIFSRPPPRAWGPARE